MPRNLANFFAGVATQRRITRSGGTIRKTIQFVRVAANGGWFAKGSGMKLFVVPATSCTEKTTRTAGRSARVAANCVRQVIASEKESGCARCATTADICGKEEKSIKTSNRLACFEGLFLYEELPIRGCGNFGFVVCKYNDFSALWKS